MGTKKVLVGRIIDFELRQAADVSSTVVSGKIQLNATTTTTSSTAEVIDDEHAGYLHGIIKEMEDKDQTLIEHFQYYHNKN